MKRDELFHVKGRPVLNGLFAVEKGEQAEDESGEKFEVCRLIMHESGANQWLVPKLSGGHLNFADSNRDVWDGLDGW